MSCYVYFIGQEGRKNSPVKIGMSVNPESRLKNIQTAYPYKLKILRRHKFDCEDDARKVERTFHWLARKKFRGLEGEWFVLYGDWHRFEKEVFKLCRIAPSI